MTRHSGPLDQPPCPQTQQFTLPLPADLEDHLGSEQQAKLAKVQVKFARNVASLLTKAYAEVDDLLDESCNTPTAAG